jgi:YD repeat-containing protein
MKITQLALLLALAALLNACKKNSSDAPATPKKLKYLTQQIVVDSAGSGTRTTTTNFTYDDKKRLISSKSGDNETDYAYNDAGNVYSTIFTSTVVTPDKTTREFTYADGKVSTAVERKYTKNNLVATNNYGFAFNGGQLTEVHADGGNSGAGITLYYYDSNNNITKTDVNAGSFVTNITYDNKKSPYTNWQQTLKNVAVSSPEICSPNNTVSTSNVNGTLTYNYTYDADGYPTARILKLAKQTVKSAYTYTEF